MRMDRSSSDEDSDVSDSEIQEYAAKPYEQLKDGTFKVRGIKGTLRCPFCAGKKKQDYKYKDLLQHATGVAKGSANRNAKQKANHLALSKYLQDFLAKEVDRSELPVSSKPAVQPEEKNEELYVFPWTGIIVNITRKKDGSGFPDSAQWLREFAKHKPSKVLTFWNGKDSTAEAIVIFGADMKGFMNGAEFEKGFEKNGFGKKGWINAQRTRLGTNIFGWCAREEDYKSPGPIGEYLREKGKLTTFSEIVKEANQSRISVVADLADKIDAKNEDIKTLNSQYNEKAVSLNRILEDKERLHIKFSEDSRRLQDIARKNIKRILAEQDKLSLELDSKKRKIDSWSKELNKREAQTDREREKLEEEKKKNESTNNSLELASEEQKKADANVYRLVEEQKREKEQALSKILKLQMELEAKQKLEMEIEEMKGKLEVMKHLGNQDDEAVQAKMKEMNKSLADKIESLEDMEELSKTLLTKERETNDELQEARKALIEGVEDLLVGRADYGLKRMGEIDSKPFFTACKQRYSPEEADIQALTLCSLWQEKLKDTDWHPFKMVQIDDNHHEKILNEDDEDLKKLKEEWGVEICDAVVTALKQIEEFNPSGRYSVKALWSFKDEREATLKEFIAFCLASIKKLKRKRAR